jgi:hypothetical protein
MPSFKSTINILKQTDKDELYNPNWFDKNFLELPPSIPWDNKRELQVENVDIWEVITEMSGPTGIYASWMPYAEFYMIVSQGKIDSTYYGEGSDKYAAKRAEELSIPYPKKNDTIRER